MIKRLKACFSEDRVNTGRQPEVDVAKGFAIVFMVLCHTYAAFSKWDNPLTQIFFDVIIGGPFSAVVFLFCMGLGIRYSRNNEPNYLFKRGCFLLFLGLLLSLLHSLLPEIIWALALSEQPDFGTLLYSLIADVDILQFAGIFFLFFALIKRFNLGLLKMNILAVVLSIFGQMLKYTVTDNIVLDILFGFFWVSHDSVWFPFLNWCIIPIAGYTFGSIWMHCCDKKAFYQMITPVSWIITILFLYISSGYQYLTNYYGLGTIESFFSIILVFAMFGLCFYISCWFQKLTLVMRWLSKRVTSIYFLHWVLISNIQTILCILLSTPDFTVSDIWIVPLGTMILSLCCVMIFLYEKSVHKKTNQN